jgi:L,D-transpeptidase YcbB
MSFVPPVRQAVAAGLLSLVWAGGVAAAPSGEGSSTPAAQAVEAPTTPTVEHSPAVGAALSKLQDRAFAGNFSKDDVAAAVAFYSARKDALWTTSAGPTDAAKALVAEIGKAEQWGLDPKAFFLPDLTVPLAAPDLQGSAEAQITLAALTYARYAKGGRVRPLSISQLLDLTPPVRDPNAVLKDLEGQADPGAYLVGLHPKHEQFQRLRAELVKRLGPVTPPAPVDEALMVKLPADGATIKPGSLHPDIALLRKRLKQPAPFAGQETLYDEKLAAAVTAFQTQKGLKANGQINGRTRTALNREGERDDPQDNSRDTQRIVINMERWRWMPEHLGTSHVINNVPEYITRTFRDGKVIFKEKIVVGLPDWPTPSFSAEMKTIVFNPSWGVPDGIKAKELKPRLQRAGGGGFFDQLFGGGGGGAVIRAYGFTAYRDGRPVDPDSIDWSSADLRQYSFIQPPGGENPLGFVKFMFPNSHDVYMHDTTQRSLFAQSRRPFSHGCIRVNDPMRFAEVLMEQDKGWSRERVAAARRSSETITLDNHIWVHNVYLTTWIDDDGKVLNFGDVYGLDNRVSQALGGRAIRSIESPAPDVETSSIVDDGAEPPRAKKKKDSASAKPSKQVVMPSSFSEAMSGLLAN